MSMKEGHLALQQRRDNIANQLRQLADEQILPLKEGQTALWQRVDTIDDRVKDISHKHIRLEHLHNDQAPDLKAVGGFLQRVQLLESMLHDLQREQKALNGRHATLVSQVSDNTKDSVEKLAQLQKQVKCQDKQCSNQKLHAIIKDAAWSTEGFDGCLLMPSPPPCPGASVQFEC